MVPWQKGIPGSIYPEVESKLLSIDDEDGSASLLVTFPPNWSISRPHYLDVDDEFFVLDGSLEINGREYAQLSYGHLPKGYMRQSMHSRDGAVALVFLSGEGRRIEADSSSGCDETRLVEQINGLEGEWTGNFHPQFPPGAGRKWLRRDPHDREETWLLGTMPLRSGRRPEKHPVVEEMYLLSGSLVGPLGTMHAGTYFWRPPEEWHGPFGSMTGNLMLFRTKGGPLSTVYTEDEVEFSWCPAHAPILPPSLAEYGKVPGTAQTRF
jgi:hypothetical protein